MKIGVDIDGVLTDVQKWIFNVGGKYFAKFGKSIKNTNAYNMRDVFEARDEECKSFWDENLIDYLSLISTREKASEVLNRLKADGHSIVIITARSERNFDINGEKKSSYDITKEWLNKNDICYDKLIFTQEEKSKYCKMCELDVMIEDSPANINEISQVVPVICFDCEYNKDIKSDYRVKTWQEVYKSINKIKR